MDINEIIRQVTEEICSKYGAQTQTPAASDGYTPADMAKYIDHTYLKPEASVNEIRKMIVFAPHNLFTDPPFGKLDLVSCRNVMIYFQPVLQKTLFGIFHSALKDGGYLFLGKSESINDLTNFLSSTMIGILFLDDNLNIRKFTEYVGREFNIMAHDVGRSIQIVAHLFQDIDIVEDAEAVLRSLMPIDKEVTTVDGKNYTLRIAPYRTTENSIEGLVLTIIDSIGEK